MGRCRMNLMLSNLSHDLDVSLAYSIDREVRGSSEPDLVALVSGLDGTPRPRPWPPILPCGQGRLLLFGEQCDRPTDRLGAGDDSAHPLTSPHRARPSLMRMPWFIATLAKTLGEFI